ncbi:L-asparaginase [Roseovarius atlanticus]|uniref:L-asparaginase n=1 Tax=Roseovarius atlanticus TaxID=1641875 RepID=A0A0T5NYU2_9RHOB|nr:L-asparaginase [Roseovarius atlanticus]
MRRDDLPDDRRPQVTNAVPLTEIWRGDIVESLHLGHAVICNGQGEVIEGWGDADAVTYPRSSAKMIQAMPLVDSGAADAFGLGPRQLALACASHQGAAVHTEAVNDWIHGLGLSDDDFRCGPQMPQDRAAFNHLIKTDGSPCQVHNNCSGKHAGFMTLSKHLNGGPEYVDPDHPVQRACFEAFEELTGERSPGFAPDGCNAPNSITTMRGIGRAMGWFANATTGGGVRQDAAVRLREAMIANPLLVAGEKRACTELMKACHEPVALKTGAEGFFVAIAPTKKLGIALKAADGSTRAANCTIAALLVRIGVLDPQHPATLKFMNAPILNRRKVRTGIVKPVDGLLP